MDVSFSGNAERLLGLSDNGDGVSLYYLWAYHLSGFLLVRRRSAEQTLGLPRRQNIIGSQWLNSY
jgi:hypothetical protein